jgi:hypothetical protein
MAKQRSKRALWSAKGKEASTPLFAAKAFAQAEKLPDPSAPDEPPAEFAI